MLRLRRTSTQIIVIAICFLVIIGSFLLTSFLYTKQIRASYDERLEKANKEIVDNQLSVYIAKENILFGEEITMDKLEYKKVFTSLSKGNFITQKDIGKISLINIEPQMPILGNMITDHKLADDLREEVFNVFYLNHNLVDNDYVDIRILYPNSEDYIVLSKKAVKNLSLETNHCFMWLNEEEIITISSAIVDTYLNEGTKLYTVKYIDPLIQTGSIVTYTPSQVAIGVMLSNPNIVEIASQNLSKEIRRELEYRLDDFYQRGISSTGSEYRGDEREAVISNTIHIYDENANVDEEEEFNYVD